MDDFLSIETLEDIVNLLIRLVELAGALVIFTGAVLAFAGFLRRMIHGADSASFSLLRLGLGRFLILGLEFQLASDILRTAVSPTFEDLLLLLFVAAIRTALNYVLRLEMRDESAEIDAVAATVRAEQEGLAAATASRPAAFARPGDARPTRRATASLAAADGTGPMTVATIVAVAVLAMVAVVVTLAGGVRTGAWRASAHLGLRFLLGASLVGLTGQPGWWPALVVGVLVAMEAAIQHRAIGEGLRALRRRPAGSTRS